MRDLACSYCQGSGHDPAYSMTCSSFPLLLSVVKTGALVNCSGGVAGRGGPGGRRTPFRACTWWTWRAVSAIQFAFFLAQVESLGEGDPGAAASVSRLHMVDLAGSERQARTGAAGQRLREAGLACLLPQRCNITLWLVLHSLQNEAHAWWAGAWHVLCTYHTGMLQSAGNPEPCVLNAGRRGHQRSADCAAARCGGALRARQARRAQRAPRRCACGLPRVPAW